MDDKHNSIDISKGQEIIVVVEEAQRDLILVTYKHGTQVFQGVLLDATKGQLPCGIYPPGGEFPPKPPSDTTGVENEDKLYSVKQRHTYFQSDGTSLPEDLKEKKGVQLRKSISLTQRFKNSRMTVRLRPRQVLCSKCQSICNEKSENVSGAKGQKAADPAAVPKNAGETRGSTRNSRERGSQEHDSNSSSSRRSERSPQKSVMLVPKLVKLKPSEIEAATNRRSPSQRGSRSDSDSCDNELNVGLGANSAYSVFENNNSSEGKVPKLKLSTNMCPTDNVEGTKKKGRIPKMTIVSSLGISPQGNEASKDIEKVADSKSLSIPKMILSTSGIVSEYVGDKKDKESTKNRKQGESSVSDSRADAKELRLRSGNIHKLTISAAVQGYSESVGEHVSPIPKLTILPLMQKKESPEEKEIVEAKHNKIVKAHNEDLPAEKMSLRKKRSLGLMEDLWDESVFDETAKKHRREDSEGENISEAAKQSGEEKESTEGEKPKATPVLKISFGPEGKGTVLKIPSKSTAVSLSTPEVETEEEISKKSKDISAKAAKKALKKAKKEAQRKAMMGNASPASVMGGMSPRFGGMSPLRLGGVSPARLGGFSPARFGGTSPARFGGMSPARAAAVDLSTRDLPTKKHKHKMKHKKKHKDERRHKSQEDAKTLGDIIKDEKKEIPCLVDSTDQDIPIENITPEIGWNSSETRDTVDSTNPNLAMQLPNSKVSPQQSTLTQSRHKLSISIKRVSNASYVACDSSHSDGERTVTPTGNSSLDDLKCTPEITSSVDIPLRERTQEQFEDNEPTKKQASDISVLQDEEKSCLPTVESSESYHNNSFPSNAYRIETPEPSLPGSDSPGSDDQCSGSIPDFPSSAPSIEEMGHTSASLLMKLSWQEVNHCNVSDGRIMKVGDVVWGKIHGFPWWPAKIMSIRILREGNGETKWQQAHVSWYGSSTRSLMPADSLQPFLQMFKVRYNKRKRGPYREAIKQATCEAEQTSCDPQLSLPFDPHGQPPPLQTPSQVQLRTSTQIVNHPKYLKTLQMNQQYLPPNPPPQQVSPTLQQHSVSSAQQAHQLQQPPIPQQPLEQKQQLEQQQQPTPENLPVLSASPREVDVVS